MSNKSLFKYQDIVVLVCAERFDVTAIKCVFKTPLNPLNTANTNINSKNVHICNLIPLIPSKKHIFNNIEIIEPSLSCRPPYLILFANG